MKMKQCSKCRKLKPLSEFHKNKNKKDGHTCWCKPCSKEYGKKYTKVARYSKNNKCIDCGKLITNNATRCDSCNQKKRFKDPKNHPNFKDGKGNKNGICIDCGKSTWNHSKRCKRCANIIKNRKRKGIKFSKELCKKYSIARKQSYIDHPEIKEKISNALISRGVARGKNNPAYIEGLIREYPIEFNKQLKEQIRKRDNNICQLCGKTQEENGRKLSVHHIDYDKFNIEPENLIVLCRNCHMKTNINRYYWTEYFKGSKICV